MKISYDDKENINTNNSIPNKNKVTSGDMNNIKSVVNNNYDEFTALSDTVSGLNTRIGNNETNINNNTTEINDLKDNLETVEGNISDLEDNVYSKFEVNNLLSYKADKNEIPTKTSDLVNDSDFVDVTEMNSAINVETTNRENADTNLQNQIDGITASSDVVDIVGTYQDLLNYDTQHLGDNDIIKVLNDSTHNNAVSYFRWKKQTSTWQYVGSEGPYYTKGETDSLLNGKVSKEDGKGLSTNDFTNELKSKLEGIESNAEVNKIETIKVNNVTQTITNKTVNITVPTKTSDLSNDSGFITKSVSDLDNYYTKTQIDTTFTNYYTKTQIDNLIGDINTALDTINGEVI